MNTLYEKIIKIRKLHKCAFHMPGSKGGKAIPKKYRKNVWKLDYTELPDTDNLCSPCGIIKDAETRAADIYGSSKCFYLVNGSSGGIFAAMGYLSSIGRKIIVDRCCHISVLNAIKLFNMDPVFVCPEYLSDYGITDGISSDELNRSITENPDAVAVFITSPNYYGMVQNVKEISSVCKKNNLLLCVDAAHGAHFAFSHLLPECAAHIADITIMSIHKTLPAPTQSAIMHISETVDADKMKKQINMLQTTSPSYILMSYTDVAVSYMNENGDKIYRNLKKCIDRFKRDCLIDIVPTDDFTRLVLNTCSIGKSGFELADFLADYGIMTEAADLYNVICICGKGNTKHDFSLLLKCCNRFAKSPEPSVKPVSSVALSKGNINLNVSLPVSEFDIKDCEGRLSASNICTYPPGIPIIFEGERFTANHTEFLQNVFKLGGSIIGQSNGKVKCFIENK